MEIETMKKKIIHYGFNSDGNRRDDRKYGIIETSKNENLKWA